MPLSHSGWSVWIAVDGEELSQYAVKVEERPGAPPDVPKFYTMSAWIPSQAGKEFSIHVEYDEKIKRKTDTAAYVDLDGRPLNYGRLFSKDVRIRGAISGEHETEMIERSFVFTTLKLTDQETMGNNVNSDQIGTINLRLSRCQFISLQPQKFVAVPSSINPLSVHETAKKAASHCVSLGAPKLSKFISTGPTRNIDRDSFLTFKFCYASADILRAREIMPSDATVRSNSECNNAPGHSAVGESSNPIEINDTDESENDEAERQVQNQIKALRKELHAMKKRKINGSEGTGLKKPKIEEDVKPSRFKLERGSMR